MSQRNPASLIHHYADSTDPDRRTSMADARIALCLARGVDMVDIDPASGYNYSRDAYDRCRRSWIMNIKDHGFSDLYEGEALRRAIATWTAHRPGFISGDDWLAAATEAHLAFWSALGRQCSRETCDLHGPDRHTPTVGDPGLGEQVGVTTTYMPSLLHALDTRTPVELVTSLDDSLTVTPDPDGGLVLTVAETADVDTGRVEITASVRLPAGQRLPLASALRRATDVARGWED